ncbi:MAG TPA: DmsC/YnfH family molybdoenzyme membrane anchor subunit [Methylomirabilota bacterium]|nr:DmsC/YnfH family molybdoenzyme membrane anchor subunit [Methylomirabilota bacterium]
MATITRPPVELIPAEPQRLWGPPAVINFCLGGLGAGLYVAAVLAARFAPSSAGLVASWLGPALVAIGFVAVATEAGRPLRGIRVLARVRTSWMSRELWLGGAFILLVAADLVFPLALHRAQAAAAALLFILAQGFIVRRSRGVTAWDTPLTPVVFLFSALISGSGLYLMIAVSLGRLPDAMVMAAVAGGLAAGLLLWVGYLASSRDPSFVAAVRPMTEARARFLIVGGGYIWPLLLSALAWTVPATAAPALYAAGALMIAGQLYAKTRLILGAGQLRPITLASLRLDRRSS